MENVKTLDIDNETHLLIALRYYVVSDNFNDDWQAFYDVTVNDKTFYRQSIKYGYIPNRKRKVHYFQFWRRNKASVYILSKEHYVEIMNVLKTHNNMLTKNNAWPKTTEVDVDGDLFCSYREWKNLSKKMPNFQI
jgi:hypothetical protein